MARGYIATSSGGVTSDETTVTKDKVLIGETYLGSDTDDEVGTGTMPNNGAISGTLNAGQSKSIPAGYTTGGTITANSLASQTSANATAAYILNPYTAWVNGSKLTGSMTNYSGKTSTSNYVSSNFRSGTTGYIFASPGATGYFTSGTYLRIPATNLAAGNIKKGVQIMGITGTFEGYATSPLYLFNNGTWGGGISGFGTGYYDYSSYIYNSGSRIYVKAHSGPGGTSNRFRPFNATIDLTNYNYLKVTVLNTGSAYIGVGINTSPTVRYDSDISIRAEGGRNGTVILNISSCSGWYYIYIIGSYSDSINTASQVYLSLT